MILISLIVVKSRITPRSSLSISIIIIIIIMTPDNELHKGEFIVRIVFLCIKSKNSGLKIEGSLNSEYWVPHLKIFFDKVP